MKENEESWEIDRNRQRESGNLPGDGEFGGVNKGSYRGQDGRGYDVTAKRFEGINEPRTPNFAYNCLARTVLQVLFLSYEVIFKYYCFFVLFRCEEPLFRVLKAILF